ncbi:MAG: sugar kinase, partial [Deltaproteobacteria bacterium]|nr:sugar kinase [Deltaproteobacteria bacterium]
YAAKMSGLAPEYDLFTPDVGELAFLADEEAPHPVYTRGFILHEDMRVPELIKRAYRHENAANHLLVKGQPDMVADREGVHTTIDLPLEAAMEAIGGTGDTVTGVVAALIGAGIEVREAAVFAARVNRLAGHYARPTPATQVMDVVRQIPTALAQVLNENAMMSGGHHV